MSFTRDHDLGNYINVVAGSDNVSGTAAGAGDNTEVVGLGFDRFAVDLPLSALLCIRYKAVLTAAKTFSLALTVESADDAAFTAPVALLTQASKVVETGAAGGSTNRSVFQVPVDLAGAKQYVRVRYTPDLSAAAADTVELSSVWVLGGQRNLPA